MTSILLEGQTFGWITWDPSMTISSALRSMLNDYFGSRKVRISLEAARGLEEVAALVQRTQASLLTLIGDENHVVHMAKTIRQVRSRSPATVRLVYLTTNFEQFALLMLEASAQIVVGELPSLQRVLPRIAECAPMKSSGYHPLTSGLVDRLPWPDVLPNSQRNAP